MNVGEREDVVRNGILSEWTSQSSPRLAFSEERQ